MIDACRAEGVPSLVFASSASAASDGKWNDHLGAVRGSGRASTYGKTKFAAETLVREAHGKGLATVCVRPQVVLGPRDPLFTDDLLFSATPPPVIGTGATTYTPVYVKNLAALFAVLPKRLEEEQKLGRYLPRRVFRRPSILILERVDDSTCKFDDSKYRKSCGVLFLQGFRREEMLRKSSIPVPQGPRKAALVAKRSTSGIRTLARRRCVIFC